MSRIGKKPVPIPDGVTVKVDAGKVVVKGKAGELSFEPHANMQIVVDAATKSVLVNRPDEERLNKSLHGLTRTLINNMVVGVVTPFEKKLEIQGVGYQASVVGGKKLKLQVGFANVIELPIPAGVTCTLTDPTHIVLKSCDKQAVGQFAAKIRNVRPPEPYKGKGIRFDGERVRRKAGKAFAGG
jgi:large subunit ribosomal protein L6